MMSGGRRGFANMLTMTAMMVVAFAALVDRNHGYVSHRRGAKSQRTTGARSGYPSEPAAANAGKADEMINVCSLEQKTTINLFCYCDEPTPYAATSADCWVFNDGEPQESQVWREFRSQSNVTKLTFNVRGSTDKTLSFVPTDALAQLPELKTLEIVYANIQTVHTHAFANLSKLQDLALSRNRIVRLAGGSIANMEDLRVITLGDNAIDGISNDVFSRLPALRKLYMDRNNISYVAEGAFEQLRKLEELDLNENRLSGSLSRYVFLGLVALKRLDMRANRLDRVGPDAFAEMVSLEELVLEDNAIKTIDGRGFAGLANLQRLTLSKNRLTTLDDHTFQRLEKLKFLDIRSNQLHTLTFATVEPVWDRLQNTSFYFYVQGNAFQCDCGLLWMNQMAAETTNEQVHRELSEAKCSMNDTADNDVDAMQGNPGGGGDNYGGFAATGPRKAYDGESDVPGVAAGGLGVFGGGKKKSAAVDAVPSGSAGAEDAVAGVAFDEFYKTAAAGGHSPPLTLVSSLNEDTCPGKEQPLVDGAPDAAQNSDRVLWESNKSSGVGGVATVPGWSAASMPALMLLLLSALAVLANRC